MHKINTYIHSITVQILLVIFSLLLPVIVLSCHINQRFMQDGITQVKQAHTRLLENYMIQIDHELELAENYTNSLTFYNEKTVSLADRSSSGFYYSLHRLNADISDSALYYQYISGFFVCIPDSDLYYTRILDTELLSDNDRLQAYIRGTLTDRIPGNSGWHYTEIDGDPYFIQFFYSNGIYSGAFLSQERLLSRLALSDGQNIRFCPDHELDELMTELPKNCILLHTVSEKCTLSVYEILDRREALSSLPFLQRYLQWVTLFMLLVIPLVLLFLYRIIIQPLHRLTHAMQELETGNLDLQVDGPGRLTEFQQIGSTFNHMTREIKDLKIDIYEKQLLNQKIQLQNLSYQLRPHFMINSLNMVYNMIISRDYDTASRLIRFSAGYMRYLLKLQKDFVPLQEELNYLHDYMNIQLLRYENQFCYEFTVDPFVKDIRIPTMILQNIIENSIKYSIGPDHFTSVKLSVDYCETDGIPCAEILVRDNGKGYPNWLLEALSAQNLERLGDCIGLRNSLQRIRMLYGSRAQCRFYNDNGAVNEFIFPLETEGEGKEHEFVDC